MQFNPNETALVLIGFQNDYFADNGSLHSVIEKTVTRKNILPRTVNLINELIKIDVKVFNTPILFSPDYAELKNPMGLMAKIKQLGAFNKDKFGGETVPEIQKLKYYVNDIDGKTGFDAFNGTELNSTLLNLKIKNIAFAGVVTSICIDSSARAAFEHKYNPIILSDCIGGRNDFEDDFYCNEVFPLFANVITSDQFIKTLK